MRHRIIRVVPIYYLLSAPLVVWSIYRHEFDFEQSVATVLFWPAMPKGMVEPYLNVGWTLCFEMLFYVSMAIALVGKRMWAIPLTIFVFSWIATLVIPFTALKFLGNPIILEFLTGVMIALLWHHGMKRSTVVSILSGTTVVIFVVYLLTNGYGNVSEAPYTMDASLSGSRVVLFGIPAALLVAGFLQCESILVRLPLAPLVFLGDASYSIYLVHPYVTSVAEKVLKHIHLFPNGAAWMLFVCVASIFAGGVVYYLVEAPLLNLLRGSKILTRQVHLTAPSE